MSIGSLLNKAVKYVDGIPVMTKAEMAHLFSAGVWKFRSDSHDGLSESDINKDGSRQPTPNPALTFPAWYDDVLFNARARGFDGLISSDAEDYRNFFEDCIAPVDFVTALIDYENDRRTNQSRTVES